MGKDYPGDGFEYDTVKGTKVNIAEETARKASFEKMTDKQKKLYNDFQSLKAKAEIKKFGYGKKLPTKK
jgi:hypothetical protein